MAQGRKSFGVTQPAYYGIKLLHQIAPTGDTFVDASSGADTRLVHAVKRRNGGFGLLLINEDLGHNVSVTVSVNGYTYATKGVRYDYGKSIIEAGKGITEEPVENPGSTFRSKYLDTA